MQRKTTHINEQDLLTAASAGADFEYVKWLLPDDYDLFYKWGGELGTGASLTYSFVGGGQFAFGSEYFNADYDYTGNGVGDYQDFQNFANSSAIYNPIAFSDNEKDVIEASLKNWANISGIDFTFVEETGPETFGDIRFYKLNFDAWADSGEEVYQNAAAFAYHPVGGDPTSGLNYLYDPVGGDIVLDNEYVVGDGYFEHVVAHEIGHALGLAHPFEGFSIIGDENHSLYNNRSVMSYNDDFNVYPISPMPIDMLAMEFLYGSETQANVGDSLYTIDNYLNEGGIYSNGLRTSIVDDQGASDKLDFSTIQNGVFTSLMPGSWSNISGDAPVLISQTMLDRAFLGSSFSDTLPHSVSSENDFLQFGNIYISSETFIENCELTEYSDLIYDNSSDNIINCNSGDDKVSLSSGNDIVDGGTGVDELSLLGGAQFYTAKEANGILTIEGDVDALTARFNLKPDAKFNFQVKNFENISFYDETGRSSESQNIKDFVEANPAEEDKPMTYNPSLDSISTLTDPNTGQTKIQIFGSGVSNASDYQDFTVNLSEPDGSSLYLHASNYKRSLFYNNQYGTIKENGADSFVLEFTLKPGLVLPTMNTSQWYFGGVDPLGENVFSGVNNVAPGTFIIDTSTSSNNEPAVAVQSLDVSLKGVKENDGSEFLVTGQLDTSSASALENLNHVEVQFYVELENGNGSYQMRQRIKSEDVNADGSFSVVHMSYGTFNENPTIQTINVQTVSDNGASQVFDFTTGVPTAPQSGGGISYGTFDAFQGEYETERFNVSDFYVTPGEYISLNIDHATLESKLTYGDVRSWWGDDITWLNIDSAGNLSGVVPDGFSGGGGDFTFTAANDSNQYTGQLHLSRRFDYEDDKSDGRLGQIEVGNHYTNTYLDGSVYFNSTGNSIYHGTEQVAPYSILFADGTTVSLSEFEALRGTRGIETQGTVKDDYFDLSGYTQNDFYGTPYYDVADLETSPGNDIYIAPEGAFDGHRSFVGVIDSRSHFTRHEELGLDVSGGLEYRFDNSGGVTITDQANGYTSIGRNIQQVTTSRYSNDVVYDDAAYSQYLESAGGHDTFYMSADQKGDDDFLISYYAGITPQSLTIFGYEENETITIRDFGLDQNFVNQGAVRYDQASGQTVISVAPGEVYSEKTDILKIDGYWEVSSANLRGEKLDIKLVDPLGNIQPLIEGTDDNDNLSPTGSAWRYDEGMTTTKELEIYGYKGADDIAGGAGNDILDGGEEDQINKYGRDVFIDDDTPHTVENSMGVVIDRVFYLDDPSRKFLRPIENHRLRLTHHHLQ